MLKNNNFSTWYTFNRLWPIISPFKVGLVMATIALMVNAASDTFMISLLKPLLDDGFINTNNNIFIWMPGAIIVLIVIRGISGFISSYCISWVSGKVVMDIRRRLFNHIMDMPVTFFDQQPTGTLLSRITYDSEQVASSSSSALIVIIREGSSIISMFIMMFYYSWQLSLILLFIAPIVSLVIRLVSKKFRHVSKHIQNTMGKITISAEQMLKGHKEVLIFGGQEIENEQFNSISNLMRQQSMKMVSISSVSDPLIQLIAALGLVFILYVASFKEVMEQLTAGTITVIFSLMVALMRPLKSLTNVNSQFQRGMSACQTVFSILDMETEKDFGTREIARVKGDIIFKNVNFTYFGNESPSLTDISFSIPSGYTVAFVGRSGSGKSTIANLLMRFYDIKQGQILIDGIDLHDYKLNSLRNQIALVSQNIYLFDDTIANNIAYARKKNYSREQVENAARMAYAMEFIEKMDYGLDTIIHENGILLSGGQRQRIAIARALLRDCPILVLDEATSALDFESEQAIQKAMNILKKNRTSLIMAHRLSTIEQADKIFVLERGYIVEHGNHAELMMYQGIYAQLYRLQFRQQ